MNLWYGTSASIPIKVDPLHLERLWIALEELLGQLHLEVAILRRKGFGWLAILIHDPNLHPMRALGVQGCVFFAIFPKSCIAIRT